MLIPPDQRRRQEQRLKDRQKNGLSAAATGRSGELWCQLTHIVLWRAVSICDPPPLPVVRAAPVPKNAKRQFFAPRLCDPSQKGTYISSPRLGENT